MADNEVCDGAESLWGMSAGAVVSVFLFSGFVLGCLCGGGLVWLLTQRAKATKQVEGGWRISAPAHTHPGKDSSAAQEAASASRKKRQNTESIDDQTFADILRQTVLVLGRDAPKKSDVTPSPGKGQVAPQPADFSFQVQASAQTGNDSLEISDDMCMHGSRLHDSVNSSAEHKRNNSKGASTGPTSPIPEAPPLGTSATPEQLVISVENEYDLDDLDDDWIVLLHKIDERLMDDGKPTLVACERSVAIRSLLATPTDEDCDVALDRAIQDVTRFRTVE